jgi:hypothetical protein
MPNQATGAQITAWLATQQDAMIALLREMVDIDSGSYNKPGIDLCPSQLSGMINQCVLQPLALEIIPDLTGRRLSNIYASPPGQMISAYFVHCPPPLPSPSPVLLSTAPVRRLPDVLHPGEVVVVRGRICSPRIVVPALILPATS